MNVLAARRIVIAAFLMGLSTVGAIRGVEATDWGEAVDKEPPTVAILGVPETAEKKFSIRIVFSESVRGFSHKDVTVKNGKLEEFTGENRQYHAKVVPNKRGPVTIIIAANVVQDVAGNAGPTEDISATAALETKTSISGTAPHNKGKKKDPSPTEAAIDEAQKNLLNEDPQETEVDLGGDPPDMPELARDPEKITGEDEEFVDMEDF